MGRMGLKEYPEGGKVERILENNSTANWRLFGRGRDDGGTA
jgi:hypothetical protein